MDKLLTIVVPTYNMERYLNRCLDSLLLTEKSLFSLLQVIIVNDGSKDNSLQIALDYKKSYPNVFEVVDKSNGNYGSCINIGIKLAAGKYFRILDADDWFDSEQLALFLKKIDFKENIDILFTNYTVQSNKKQFVCSENVEYEKKYAINDFDFASTHNQLMFRMHSMTFQTELLRKCNLTLQEGISYTDTEYCFYPFCAANNMMFFNVNLYQYFIGREGQTVSKDSVIKNFDHFYKVGKRMLYNYLQNKNLSVNKRNSLANFISNALYYIYCVAIIYKRGRSPEYINILKEIDNLVRKEETLNREIIKLTYKKIPFIKFWRYLSR